MRGMNYDPTEMWIGASWYPEMWPEEEWIHDADRMQELGFNMARLFEFAWHRFEPEEGHYDFAWARRVLDLLHERGISAIIGTPTAAPPAWLSSRCPDILKTRADGSKARHGKRCHGSPASETYRKLSHRFVSRMAAELGSHPAVAGWQIDNEMGGADHGQEALEKFHAFLAKKFGDIEHLNRTWGLEFWSQAYNTFEQIQFSTTNVGSRDVPERSHPSLIMAQGDFFNEQWREFIANQVEAIRPHSSKPISSNMTGFVGGMDWFRHFKELDIAGASMYADLNYYHYNFPRFDRLRAEKPGTPWILWETAPNWSGGGPIWNIHHEGAGVRAMSWLTTISGSAATVFWQWRSHWAGQEMQHGTHVSQTGNWAPGKETWTQLATEYRTHGAWLMENRAATGDIGILVSSQSQWAFSIDPIDPANKYEERVRDDYILPLIRNHWFRDIIHPSADFTPYKVLIVAHHPMLDDDARTRLHEYVEQGGTLIFGPLSGHRTTEFTSYTDKVFGGLEGLIGAESKIRFSPHWVETDITLWLPTGETSHPRFWCEGFEPTHAEVLATYEGGWGSGSAAVLRHEVGRGVVYTLGCPLDEAAWLSIVEAACNHADVTPVAVGSDKVLVVPRANREGIRTGFGLVNYTKEPQRIALPESGIDLLTGEMLDGEFEMEPLGVRVVRV